MAKIFDALGKRYLAMASLAAETFKDPKLHIYDLRVVNGRERIFHLNMGYPISLTDHKAGTTHIGKEIVLGYNEDFRARVLPFYRAFLRRNIRPDKLRDGRSIVIEEPGKISYASLFLTAPNRYIINWHYPAEDVVGRQNWVFTQFDNGDLSFIFARFFDIGKLDEHKELDENDSKNLTRILDECEPWLKELVSLRR